MTLFLGESRLVNQKPFLSLNSRSRALQDMQLEVTEQEKPLVYAYLPPFLQYTLILLPTASTPSMGLYSKPSHRLTPSTTP
jgi:hypothetical protein